MSDNDLFDEPEGQSNDYEASFYERENNSTSRLVGKLGFPRKSAFVPYVDDASGLPVDSDAPSRRRNENAVGRTTSKLLEKLGIPLVGDIAPTIEDKMVRAWREIAGDLAQKLEPEKFVNGILYVLANNSAELFEIRRFKLRTLEAKAKQHQVFASLRQIRIHIK